jgi:hypothetical protein
VFLFVVTLISGKAQPAQGHPGALLLTSASSKGSVQSHKPTTGVEMSGLTRTLLAIASLAVVTAVLAGAAWAFCDFYAGPKTWLQGWDQGGQYDAIGFYWDYNEMGPKSDDACYAACTSRVAFIDTSGSWHFSKTDSFDYTQTIIPDGFESFKKKPYCKNNSSYVYTAACGVCT